MKVIGEDKYYGRRNNLDSKYTCNTIFSCSGFFEGEKKRQGVLWRGNMMKGYLVPNR